MTSLLPAAGAPLVDDDGFRYDAVQLDLEDEASLELPPDDDLNAIVKRMMGGAAGGSTMGGAGQGPLQQVGGGTTSSTSSPAGAAASAAHGPSTERLPSVADDFIRNFLIRAGMSRSLDAFNTEWFELKAKGKLPTGEDRGIPDVYAQNQRLEDLASQLRLELEQAQDVAAKAQSAWDRFRRERDFHRMHHKRVVQEKNKLVTDLKRLKAHYEKYEPLLEELRAKYELAMKEKMLMRLERDRLAARVAALDAQARQLEATGGGGGGGGRDTSAVLPAAAAGATGALTAAGGVHAGSSSLAAVTRALHPNAVAAAAAAKVMSGTGLMAPTAASKARIEERFNSGPMPPIQAAALAKAAAEAAAVVKATRIPDSKLPTEDTINPFLERRFEAARVGGYKLTGTIKAHGAPIAGLAFHPTKPVFVTASDDATWRMWAVQSASDAELIMNGEGHRAWLAEAEFHPSGAVLATCSGEGLVKLWNLATQTCSSTLADHTQTCWDLSFHHLGDFLATASMDHSTKLWDVHTGRVRQTFRGHADSVNAVSFQPYSVNLATGSGDKTVSVWDARSGQCIQSFYGHSNAVNDVAFNLRGDTIVSCDANGEVKLWDVRMVVERAGISLGAQPVHSVAFDRSAEVIAAACDDGVVRVIDALGNGNGGLTMITSLRGHEDSVQAVCFDPTAQYLVSTGNDATVRIWSEGDIKLPQLGLTAGGGGGGPAAAGGGGGGGGGAPSPWNGGPDGDD